MSVGEYVFIWKMETYEYESKERLPVSYLSNVLLFMIDEKVSRSLAGEYIYK